MSLQHYKLTFTILQTRYVTARGEVEALERGMFIAKGVQDEVTHVRVELLGGQDD